MNDSENRIDRSTALNIASSCVGFNIRKTARRIGHIYDLAFSELGLKNTNFQL